MTEELPHWAQPIFSKHHCSICQSDNVFFEKLDHWDEKIKVGHEEINQKSFAMKCYCKDCFEECGGDGHKELK